MEEVPIVVTDEEQTIFTDGDDEPTGITEEEPTGVTGEVPTEITDEESTAITEDEEESTGSTEEETKVIELEPQQSVEGISCSCGPQEITPEMLDGNYGDDYPEELDDSIKYTPSELELKRRLESKRCDAAILARPLDYQDSEIDLSVQQEEHSSEMGTQIEEFEVEKDLAAERKIALTSKTNTLWPTNDEFTKDKAEKRIEDYITRCWSLDPNWLFHIEFLQMSCTTSKRKYIYEVKFSMPTSQFPVPFATASVFFVLEVAYYEGHTEAVKVHYIVEGTRYQHYPGAIPFQQKWLKGIIAEKTKLQRLIDF